MFSELAYHLEMSLQEKVQLLPRGHHMIGKIHGNIPSTWADALLPHVEISTSIEFIWKPVHSLLNALVTHLKQEIFELALVVSMTLDQPLGLLYIFRYMDSNGDEIFVSWLGGLPLTEAQVSQYELHSNIRLPESYKRFSQIHNGFLQNGRTSLGMRPINKLYLISEIVKISSWLDYDPRQLLAFCGDGGGNEQCFNLALPISSQDYETVDWDHETEQISKPQIFWDFYNDFLLRNI